MRKTWSRMISCFAAAAMIVTSSGVSVMADTLLEEETNVLTIENESETGIAVNDESDIDAKIGLPIDIHNESDRDNTGSDLNTEGEDQDHIGEGSQNGDTASASPISEGVQSEYKHNVKATDNTVQIYASGIYRNWDGVSNVAQFRDPNGGMYYAINSDSTVRICRVEAGSPVSKVVTLEKKHPLFGTAICDGDGNFYLVTGEKNDTDDTSVETVFISKYDSNGNYIATTGDNGSSSLASYYNDGFYTKIPFEAGNCDAAISGDILTVNYAREMYSGHQSNSAFSVNVKDMSKVSVGTFYESHSFAQRVVPVGTGFVYVSEGDCYDRTFTIYNVKKTNSGFTGSETGIFDFWVKDGALEEYNMYVVNENFAHMGGLTALKDGRVAFAAQSARSLNANASGEKEDVFIQIFDPSKDLRTADAYTTEGTRSGLAGPNGRDEVTNYGVKWLTSLSGTESISNVQIVSASDDSIVVFFEYSKDNSYKGVYYIVLDKDGNVIQPAAVFDAKAKLNPCEMPVYTDGMICWVGNKNGESGNKIYAYSLIMNDVCVPVTGVELNKTELTLGMNETEVLTATVLPYHATNRNVIWSSNKKEIATVDDEGKIKAVSVGEASITVTTEDGGFTDSCKVTVLNKRDAAVTIAEKSPITKTYGDSGFTLTAAAGNKGTGSGVWTWESTNTTVATVSNSGTVTVKAAGESVIKAHYESDTTVGEAEITLKVNIKTLGITWSNTSFIYDGDSHKPEATLTGVINGDDCTVTVSGEQTEEGTYTATASLSGASSGNYILPEDNKTCSFKISRIKVSNIEITGASDPVSMQKGDKIQLGAAVTPANAADKTVKWNSSSPSVVTVDDAGLITAVSYGEAVITAEANDGSGVKATLTVTVAFVKVTGITINRAGGDDSLAIGKSTQLSAVITPSNASVRDIVWTSSDTKLADVDENGVVTGRAQGKVTITATSVDDSSKKSSVDLIIFDDSDAMYVEFAYGSEYIYTGKPIMPLINVYNRGKLLMQGTDYTVKFSNNVNANDGTNAKKAPMAVVTGKTIAATAEAVFRIIPKDIGDEKSVSAEAVNIISGKTAAPLLYYGGTKLGAKDFTNPYAKDKFTESRAITVYGTGNFTGEREVWINVMDAKEVKNISKIKVLSFNPFPKTYNGQPQYIGEDEITVVSASDSNKTKLVMDRDFFIVYPDDVTNAGMVKITVMGMGDHAGAVVKSYNIEPAKNDGSIKTIEVSFPDAEGKTNGYDSFEYRPGGVFPAVEILVTHSDGKTETLTAGRDYKVTYKNNTKAGAANKNKPATATITFLGNYKSIKKMTKDFYIDQADLGRANTYAMDKAVNKDQPKYPVSEPIADIDGTTVSKKEYTVTYKVNDGEKDIEITSKDKLYKALAPGESIAVTVEINAKVDKNGELTGNYKGTAPVCRYNITRTDADHDLSKATVILQKKEDESHKAIRQLSFTGRPIEIGAGEYSDYELYVYMGKKNAPTVLKEGTDFRVDHSNNVNAGKATVMINGCEEGKYYGSKAFNFKIVKGRMLWAR